jgi:hypothetical protein
LNLRDILARLFGSPAEAQTMSPSDEAAASSVLMRRGPDGTADETVPPAEAVRMRRGKQPDTVEVIDALYGGMR